VKIYIGCGLTHVPSQIFAAYTSFIHSVASRLTEQGHQVHYALLHSDPQLATKPEAERPRLCYLWDRRMVENADLLVAVGGGRKLHTRGGPRLHTSPIP
jgi:hypothetical protein